MRFFLFSIHGGVFVTVDGDGIDKLEGLAALNLRVRFG